MKKKMIMGALVLLSLSPAFAQKSEQVTKSNSWLKAGIAASVPVGDLSNYSSFVAGAYLSGQYLVNPHFGIGIASGYTQYVAKNSAEGFGAIPAGLLLRYYPKAAGFFIGTDAGYTFLTNTAHTSGGAYVKPQLGYHNYNWNFYGFYNQVFLQHNLTDVQDVGVAATYNIRFKRK